MTEKTSDTETENMQTIGVRLPPDVVAEVDAMAERLTSRNFGSAVSRSHVARIALERGLAVLRREVDKADRK